MRVLFPFIAQLHQIPHSLPIAIELAQRHREIEVHVAYTSTRHLRFIREIVARYSRDSKLEYYALRSHWVDVHRSGESHRDARLYSKLLTLIENRHYFSGFDAVVTPECTSILLRRIGVTRPHFIWTRHGAGDRQVGFKKAIRRFDFVLLAGPKIERRLLSRKLIRPGDYCAGVYAKFDWLRSINKEKASLFDNDRPTVLYNPHFSPSLSSWQAMGWSILETFAASTRHNLIFAPHMRLFDGASAKLEASFDRFRRLPHVHIDLGSERSVDMTYTRSADIYLGDVSSQVAEFMLEPRPCLFLNPHRTAWQSDPNYESWNLGPVTASTHDIERQLEEAAASHGRFVELQRQYFQKSFALNADGPSAALGSDAIAKFLKRGRVTGQQSCGVRSGHTAQ